MEFGKMKHLRLFAALAVFCLVIGSALAIANSVPVVDKEKCTGCGKCVEKCPEKAIALNDQDIADVNKDKCIGCQKCVKA